MRVNHFSVLGYLTDWLIRLLTGSRFGAMLDQLTDRCGTLGLVMVLGVFYPKYLFWFQISAAVDIASHWLHFHATDLTGAKTHKVSTVLKVNLWKSTIFVRDWKKKHILSCFFSIS